MRISAITADRRDEFATGDGTLPDIGPLTAALWTSGDSRPQWCWLATRRGRVLARVGFRVVEDPDDPPPSSAFEPELLAAAWRRVPYTVGLFGLAYAPGPDGLAAAEELIRTAVGAAVEPGTVVEARTNPEAHPDAAARVELLGQAGFGLFQEKQGYAWAAPAGTHEELELGSIATVGERVFFDVLAAAGGATLDRNDRFYYARCGPDGWARIMLSLLEPESTETWCVGYAHGEPVGFVAVSPFGEPHTATVAHIGVVPAHRGQGYGRRLLAAGTNLAERTGYVAMLSDVDVDNGPMRAAMLATGHRDDVRPWHVWHHRLTR